MMVRTRQHLESPASDCQGTLNNPVGVADAAVNFAGAEVGQRRPGYAESRGNCFASCYIKQVITLLTPTAVPKPDRFQLISHHTHCLKTSQKG